MLMTMSIQLTPVGKGITKHIIEVRTLSNINMTMYS